MRMRMLSFVAKLLGFREGSVKSTSKTLRLEFIYEK